MFYLFFFVFIPKIRTINKITHAYFGRVTTNQQAVNTPRTASKIKKKTQKLRTTNIVLLKCHPIQCPLLNTTQTSLQSVKEACIFTGNWFNTKNMIKK